MSAASDFAQLYRLSPEEALRYLEERSSLRVTFDWRDLWQEEHAHHFTVSRLAALDVLENLRRGIIDSVAGDLSRRDFMRDLSEYMAHKGWWGERTVIDAASGDAVTTVFDPARLKLIYDTNTRQAYAAGQWERIERNKASHPYIRYITQRDSKVRDEHAQWDNITLPVEHPFWDTHLPLNGFNCRCRVVAVSRRDYERGQTPSGQPMVKAAAPERLREWTNTRTGETLQVPVGIQPGFAYNVGKARAAELAKLAGDKIAAVPASLGAAAWASGRAELLPVLAENYRHWLTALGSDPQAKSQQPIVGAIDMVVLEWLATKRLHLPASAEIAATSSPISGPKAKRHEKKGDALSVQAWERLPELIAEPIAVLYDTSHGTLLYILPDASARRGQIAVEFEFERRGQTRRNMIISGYRPLLKDLEDRVKRGDLQLVSGALGAE